MILEESEGVTGKDGALGASSSSQLSSQLLSHPSVESVSTFPPLETGKALSSFWYMWPLLTRSLRLMYNKIVATNAIATKHIIPKDGRA